MPLAVSEEFERLLSHHADLGVVLWVEQDLRGEEGREGGREWGREGGREGGRKGVGEGRREGGRRD